MSDSKWRKVTNVVKGSNRLASPILARRCPKTYDEYKAPILTDVGDRIEKIIDKLQLQPNELILDYGCANGSITLEHLKPTAEANNWTIYGVDNAETMIRYAQANNAHPCVKYEFGDVTDDDFPLAHLKFNRIFCIHYLQFISDDFLEEIQGMYKLLAPGGTMFITVGYNTVFHSVYKELTKYEQWGEISMEHVKTLDSVADCINNPGKWRHKFELLDMKVQEMAISSNELPFERLEQLAEIWFAHNPFASSETGEKKQELKEIYLKQIESTETKKYKPGCPDARNKEYIIEYERLDILFTK